ncbi:MAG: methylated-DNA--[protein]-cysteine S-methyltransferase [Alloprevotella sp.]|nr:methylated-DNA--[protein]-cysteine S-methyltransferase [Alloprevotella sp.]
MKMVTGVYRSPAGDLALGAMQGSLCLCDWATGAGHIERICRRIGVDFRRDDDAVIDLAGRQLDEYFNGIRQSFAIPMAMIGTDFQRRVWDGLLTIPYGRAISYGELARRVGCPKGMRAVAMACHANPMSIIVPCHRVIGSDGSLTGYGGGLEAKRILLALEGCLSVQRGLWG